MRLSRAFTLSDVGGHLALFSRKRWRSLSKAESEILAPELDALWSMPADAEHCKDGRLTFVGAFDADRFKIVDRHCHDPISIRALFPPRRRAPKPDVDGGR